MSFEDIVAAAPAIPEERQEGPLWSYSPGVGWEKDRKELSSREEAEYVWASMEPQSRYGYKLDVSDPKINKYYRIFKERLGMPPHLPISDAERKEFELQYLTAVIERRRQKRDQR